ncbi:MAG: preprotein translocase subunit SecG [Candidatus Paceibacterota bacterium]|nr:MAG: preprotein translocase subunit SecG [Candidatus Paceibacterota bacterium]
MSLIQSLLPFIQVALSIAIIALVMLQRSEAGVGGAFGGGDGSGSHFERRGFEKTIFNTTIVLAVIFVLASILALLL